MRRYIGVGIMVKGEPGFRDLSLTGIQFYLRETYWFQRKMLQPAGEETIVQLQAVPG